jgi:hypothetical protein
MPGSVVSIILFGLFRLSLFTSEKRKIPMAIKLTKKYSFLEYFLFDITRPVIMTKTLLLDLAKSCVVKLTYFSDSYWNQLLSTFDNDEYEHMNRGPQFSYETTLRKLFVRGSSKDKQNNWIFFLLNTNKMKELNINAANRFANTKNWLFLNLDNFALLFNEFSPLSDFVE